jgi:hypothetical protein
MKGKKNAGDADEDVVAEENEYYNIYEIYSENGMESHINVNSSLLTNYKRKGFHFGESLTGSFLS